MSELCLYGHCWSGQLNRDGVMLVNAITDAKQMFEILYIISVCEFVYWNLLPIRILLRDFGIQAYGTLILKLHRAADTETPHWVYEEFNLKLLLSWTSLTNMFV